MYFVRIPIRHDAAGQVAQEQLIADLYEAGTCGITETPAYLEAYFEDQSAAESFGAAQPAVQHDWEAEMRAQWLPIEVGERFFVVPPWSDAPTPAGRFRLVINPADQCGTGQHPCTQKCLAAMERAIRPGDAVLDVGSGSGILSIAAKMLGAGRVIAFDVDAEVARTAPLLAEHGVPLFIGTVDAVAPGSFDVLVANISEEVLGAMRPALDKVARVRILSGFQDAAGEWTCVVD